MANLEIPWFLSLLSSQLNLELLIPEALDVCLSLTGAERAFLMLYSNQGDLSISRARNHKKQDLPENAFKGSTSIVKSVIQDHKPVCIHEMSDQPAFALADSVRSGNIGSAICIPLFRLEKEQGNRLLGILYLDSSSAGNPLADRHLNMMIAVGNHLSISLENARLFSQVQQQKEEIAHLNQKLQERVDLQAGNIAEMKSLLAETQRELGRVYGLGNIVGKSEPMLKVFKLLEKMCRTHATVLIEGESGTGKDLVARYIHYNGPRSDMPMVSVNCSAFNEALLESELFGHRKGAFTGASENKTGLFELANGGTLFLDEIGEMSLEMQKKLLRVLEDGMVRPIGSKEDIRTDVRIIAATNRSLQSLVAQQKFREDLFYRINVLTIQVPPLRERMEDIPLLIDYFTNRISDELKMPLAPIPEEVMKRFLEYHWPGNVRELHNELRRVFILSSDYNNEQLVRRHVKNDDDAMTIDEAEKRAILRALDAANGNKRKAAEILKMPRSTFYLKLARYKIF